jgi:hypothetical protein
MKKVLEHLQIRKFGKKGTDQVLLILLGEVEGSGKVLLWLQSIDLVSVAVCIWIRGGKVGKVYKESFLDLKFPSQLAALSFLFQLPDSFSRTKIVQPVTSDLLVAHSLITQTNSLPLLSLNKFT